MNHSASQSNRHNAGKGTTATFFSLIMIASVALNVGFLAGCVSLHDAVYGSPCRISKPAVQPQSDSEKANLTRIAGILGVRVSGKTPSDITSDICDVLGNDIEAPKVFDPDSFEKMAKDLNTKEERAMRNYQSFVSELQGKRIIVLDQED